MSGQVLVLNAGSSSLKYQLLDVASESTVTKGVRERVEDHGVALLQALADIHAAGHSLDNLIAVGHRVVHGGDTFREPTLITDDVRAAIADLAPLAPLHNPAGLLGIDAAAEHCPGVPQVAVFDTAFHHSLPPAAYTYAVPRDWRTTLRVRRYGFHGTSFSYVTGRAAHLLGRAVDQTNLVLLHLGNGSSAAAVSGGRSIDTSMGMTPLEGLVMGTRSGNVDPALPAYLSRVAGMTAESVDAALNRESGLLGLCGVADFRELLGRRAQGDVEAAAAYDVVLHRLLTYVGAYAAQLGRVDALVFTGGVGEHNPGLRADLLNRLSLLGAVVDPQANARGSGERLVTTSGSRLAAWVIPTNEELEIARQAAAVVAAAQQSG